MLGDTGSFIKISDELKILGIVLTSDLKWTVHVAKMRQSHCKMIGVLNHLAVVSTLM